MLKEEKINPILSVGMIMKNEEKVIGRCLKSLVPLFEAIPCELIIADTGSTDRSVEIAKKYTNNVFYFKWINDFAAARNSTLEKSHGKWFLFLDADEYLDSDISELIRFFSNSELCEQFNTMTIHFRNYNDKEKRIYKDSYLPRFFKKDCGDKKHLKFVGVIHETIPVNLPKGRFETIVHHTGYCYNTKQYSRKKKIRNYIPMRQEFLEHPSTRMAVMLLESGGDSVDECEEYISYGIDYISRNKSDYYGKDFFVKAIKYYMHLYPDKALRLCNMYYEILTETENTPQSISVEMFRTEILFKLYRFKEVITAFSVYEELFQKCKTGLISVSSDTGFSIRGTMDTDYNGVRCLAIQSLIKTGKYDDAFKNLSKSKIEEYEDESYKTILKCWIELAEAKQDYVILTDVYMKILNTDNNNKIDYINSLIHDIYLKKATDEERERFAEIMTSKELKGNYMNIMRLIVSQNKNEIEHFVCNLKCWKNEYSELIYLAFKHNCTITCFSQLIHTDDYKETFTMISENHDDFAEYLLNYEIKNEELLEIGFLGFITSVYRYTAFNCEDLSDDKKLILYKRYVSVLGDYVMNLYNAEFLNEKNVSTLPGEHQFGFYMYNAETDLINGDKLGYIRNMKNALVNCVSMKEIVQFMLEQFRKNL